jgi:hypothetical protein
MLGFFGGFLEKVGFENGHIDIICVATNPTFLRIYI